jgi:hypothetical protein
VVENIIKWCTGSDRSLRPHASRQHIFAALQCCALLYRAAKTMIIENEDTYGLDDCLIVPVAAKSISSIEQFVGNIIQKSQNDKWCYVDFIPKHGPNNLEIWNHERAHLITYKRQCWVRIDYTCYRDRYKNCFPDIKLENMVIDHILNRKFSKALGFNYVRLIHIEKTVAILYIKINETNLEESNEKNILILFFVVFGIKLKKYYIN